MTDATREFELKFAGPAEVVSGVIDWPYLRAASEARHDRLDARYVDTTDGALAAAGASLRLRREGGVLVQAVKRKREASASQRDEYETTLAGEADFPAPAGQSDIDDLIGRRASDLQTIARVVVDRWTVDVAEQGSRIELSVDLGRAEKPGAGMAGIAEAELELKAGEAAAVFALARRLVNETGLRLRAPTKLETALALGTDAPFAIPAQDRPPVAAETPADELLRGMLVSTAARMIELQPAILEARLPESVHRLRVALRRFRAVERVFRKSLDTDAVYALTRRARDLMQRLGPARDLDVFLEETIPAVFDDNGGEGAAALIAAAEAQRAEAWRGAHSAVAERAYTHLALDILEAGLVAPWRNRLKPRGAAPLAEFAPRALDRSWRKTDAMAGALRTHDLAGRHPLRVALKKHRYAVQMMGKLYPREGRKPYMAAMARLQDAFGLVNDAVVAQRLADEAARAAGPDADQDAIRAAGFIAGYKASEAKAAAADIDEAWAALAAMKRFWAPPPRDD